MTREQVKDELCILLDWFGTAELVSMMAEVLDFKAEQARAQSTSEIAQSYRRESKVMQHVLEKMEN